MLRLIVLPLLFLPTVTVLAADAPAPTITLTQAEVQQMLVAERAKAVADILAQEAKATYDKVNKAFSLSTPPSSTSPVKPTRPHGPTSPPVTER